MVKLSADSEKAINQAFEEMMAEIHDGSLGVNQIHLPYYKATSGKLSEALKEGLNGDSFNFDDNRNQLKAFLSENVFAFSAAKSLEMRKVFGNLLTDDTGNFRTWAQFRNAVMDKETIYNVNYLQTEFNSAIASAQMAEKWQSLKNFPMLEFSTVGDDRVRDAHRRFDRLVLPSDHPFWKTHYPPMDWNCRCNVIPASTNATQSSDERINGATNPPDPKEHIKPYFKRNVGMDKVIYSEDHPYFNNMPSELEAEKHYNLPSVKKIYATEDLTGFEGLPNKDAATTYWQNVTDKKGVTNVSASNKLEVSFDATFAKNTDYSILSQYDDVLKNADEVWASKLADGKLQYNYVRFYDDYPVVLTVDSKCQASSMVQLKKLDTIDTKATAKARKGVLIYKR